MTKIRSEKLVDCTAAGFPKRRGIPLTIALVLILSVLYLLGLFPHPYVRTLFSPPPTSPPPIPPTSIGYDFDLDSLNVDWTRFAYAQYVTKPTYLCNSIMIFESLHRLKVRANKIVMYPKEWKVHPDVDTNESRLLMKAKEEYGVELVPIEVLWSDEPESFWRESYTKLLVFNQTQYGRLISLDSDSTVQQVGSDLTSILSVS